MQAVKKIVSVEKNKSITIKSLPFKPGSKVEVIILPAEEKDIFSFTDELVKKKGIKPMSLKEIEKIVHEVRGVE
jgi:metal-responsive CopG/Arc/MetJ family transcriptional regulator